MIESLRIRGLGVIDDAVITFGPGLTAITGETGAGKTMVLTGLNLLAGGKADAQTVRHGSDRAEVDGQWSLAEAKSTTVLIRLRDAGAQIDVEQGVAQVLLARAVAGEGRSRAFAGGRTVPVTLLQEVAGELVAVHGQSEQLRLRQSGKQRELLDRFAGSAVTKLLDEYQVSFAKWRQLRVEVQDLTRQRQSREREAAMLAIGIAEIEAVAPLPGEDLDLDHQSARLAHSGTLLEDVFTAHSALVGTDEVVNSGADDIDANVLSVLAGATKALDRAVEVDPQLAPVRDRFREISSIAADAAVTLSSYATEIDADPARQSWVEERRSVLNTLKRRYGANVDEVLMWLEQAKGTVAEVSGDEDRLVALGEQEANERSAVTKLAGDLSAARRKAGKRFSSAVTNELQALAMPDSLMEVSVETIADLEEFGIYGADEIEFLLQPHVGASPLPIGKGASGGELSRVMLAIEVVLAGVDPVPTFVFDEVDAGIGGRAAVEVGRRLARLARTAQVIVVTHLPQVAAFADQHVVIAKSADGLVTASSVTSVMGEDRISELVRMLSGLTNSQTGAAHAEELLALATTERAAK
ncbi:MAG: DNA repair protein RecN [Candidatus Nanopelagicales bacterium]|nr:DNA repair protein RecN [Candidatus Nanopelagicales bacterium]